MNTFTETKIINLNSKSGIKNNSTYLSDVYFRLNGILKDDDDIIEKYISIQNAQIPFSFYNINIYNNILNIQIITTIYTLTLTRGNYNATSLIAEIQTQLINNLITDLTITISSITGLLTFTKTTGSFTIRSSGSTIYVVLGFVVGTNYNSMSSKIIAPYPLNLLYTLRLRICSYNLSTNNPDFCLISMPIEVGNFSIIQYTNTSNIQTQLNNVSLDGFDIVIIDDDGNFLNFNNINWTMCIILNIVRKKQNISEFNFNQIINKNNIDTNKNIDETNNIDDTNIDDTNIDNINNEENDINQEYEQPMTDDLDLLLYNNHGNL